VPSRLASARAARGWSAAQVAQQMRITPETVLAMEEGRYADLGPAVFARGHLRKYAGLLGVPAEEVLSDFDASPSHAAESTLIPPASAHTRVGRHERPGMYRAAAVTAVTVVLAAVAAAGWWYWKSPGAPAASDVVPAPAAGIEEASPMAQASGQAAVGSDTAPAVAAAAGRLVLEFTGPCWVEVYDAGGRRLAFQLAEAGSGLAFDGPAPWRVVLGNADSVRLALDGAELDIPTAMRVRDAALVTIADDGTIAAAPADEGNT